MTTVAQSPTLALSQRGTVSAVSSRCTSNQRWMHA